MKKLMIAAAIVCAAVVANAAALQWSMSAITASPDGAMVAGNVAYWMAASTWDTFSKTSADQIGAYCAANNTYSTTMAVSRGAGKFDVTSGTYSAGATVSGYMVIFDATDATTAGYYANSTVKTKQVPAAGNAVVALAFDTGTTGWKATSEPEPTPEPTSALLMLLGVAGLALRRKQK